MSTPEHDTATNNRTTEKETDSMSTRRDTTTADTATADTTTGDTTTAVVDDETGQAMEVLRVAPGSLLVDLNVRTTVELDKAFVGSIRDVGVLVPIVAVRTGEGELRVRYGHRRTLAAIEAGRVTVPVVVVPDGEGDEKAREVARIVTQWSENEHRAGLNTADRIKAVEQLAAFGVSAAQIAKRTHTPRTQVDAALATAASELARAASDRYGFLTLEQSAGLAEFDADSETVTALVAAAKDSSGSFDHVLARAREDRKLAEQVEAKRAELVAAGVRVIDRPAYDDASVRPLRELAVKAGGAELDAKKHTQCTGHVAWIAANWNGVSAIVGCDQWRTAGHVNRYGNGPAVKAAELPEAEREAKRKERATTIENNKAWKAAEGVRRRFLSTFCTRRALPKGAAAYLAGELLDGGHELRTGMERPDLLAGLLGVVKSGQSLGYGDRTKLPALAEGVTDGRAQVLALAFVLAAHEQATGTHSWRNPPTTAATQARGVAGYLRFLESVGYELSPVEKIAAGTTKKPATKKPATKKAPAREAPAKTVTKAAAETTPRRADAVA